MILSKEDIGDGTKIFVFVLYSFEKGQADKKKKTSSITANDDLKRWFWFVLIVNKTD